MFYIQSRKFCTKILSKNLNILTLKPTTTIDEMLSIEEKLYRSDSKYGNWLILTPGIKSNKGIYIYIYIYYYIYIYISKYIYIYL